jgi:cold-inducible RNA-binding protein
VSGSDPSESRAGASSGYECGSLEVRLNVPFPVLLLASETAKTPASLDTRNPDNQIARFDEASMKNIYVGNLDFQSTEDDLRTAFAVYGQVDKVSIVTDRDTGQRRGFGFIEMANDAEGDKAISGLTGVTLGARALTVNEARPKREGGSFGGGRDVPRGGRGGSGRY